jgi:hypothetical protein
MCGCNIPLLATYAYGEVCQGHRTNLFRFIREGDTVFHMDGFVSGSRLWSARYVVSRRIEDAPPLFFRETPISQARRWATSAVFSGARIYFTLWSALSSPDQNALVLFGQRRIGKTSILLQLRRRLPSPPFRPVYFDLMDQARKPLSAVLYELAATIAAEFNLPSPAEADFAKGDYFRENFLPSLYQSLGNDFRPVFLFENSMSSM